MTLPISRHAAVYNVLEDGEFGTTTGAVDPAGQVDAGELLTIELYVLDALPVSYPKHGPGVEMRWQPWQPPPLEPRLS